MRALLLYGPHSRTGHHTTLPSASYPFSVCVLPVIVKAILFDRGLVMSDRKHVKGLLLNGHLGYVHDSSAIAFS